MNPLVKEAIDELVVANIELICAKVVCDEYLSNPATPWFEKEYAMKEKGKIIIDIQEINYIYQLEHH